MDGSQSSSFIPKQPARGKVKARGVRKIYVFAYISFVLFFGVLIATAGTYFYKVSVNAQLNAEKQKLADLKGQFDSAALAHIQDLERQLNLAQTIIDQHISVASLFRTLEQNAIDSINYEGLEIERDASTDVTILLSGTTGDFNSVLFQRSVIADNPMLAGSIFEDLTAKGVDITDRLRAAGVAEEKAVDFIIRKDTDPSTIPFDPQASRPAVTPAAPAPTPEPETQSNEPQV